MSADEGQVAPEVVLYRTRECPLCDEGREALEAARGSVPFRLREVDITTDEELHRRYMERIPVVVVAGEVVCDLVVETGVVAEALRRASASPR